MREIRKGYNLKIISMIIASIFFCHDIAFCIIERELTLRVPLVCAEAMKKIAGEDNSRLDGDKVEKKLLDIFYSHIPKDKLKAALIEGEVLVKDKKYKYLYFDFWRNIKISMEIGERFYRAGDIFVVDSNYAHLVPEEVKKSRVKIIYLDFSRDWGEEHDKLHPRLYRGGTIFNLISLQRLDLKGKIVVDAGTENGVIAIACSLMGAKKVYILDKRRGLKKLVRDNAKQNGVLKNLSFRYFGLTFKRLYYSRAIKKHVDVILLNIAEKWATKEGQLSQLLAKFPCKLVVVSDGVYNKNKESELNKIKIIATFEKMNLGVFKITESKNEYYDTTNISFILNVHRHPAPDDNFHVVTAEEEHRLNPAIYWSGSMRRGVKTLLYPACGDDAKSILEMIYKFPYIEEVHIVDNESQYSMEDTVDALRHLLNIVTFYTYELSGRDGIILKFKNPITDKEVRVYYHKYDYFEFPGIKKGADITLVRFPGLAGTLAVYENLALYRKAYKDTKNKKYIYITETYLPKDEELLKKLKAISYHLSGDFFERRFPDPSRNEYVIFQKVGKRKRPVHSAIEGMLYQATTVSRKSL
ncbi:MAG: 50S ribosomal protein L11 methyltransferase [Planctomycetota bacterium]|jgi:hypothetical protein